MFLILKTKAMKHSISLLFAAMMLMIACQPKTTAVAFDPAAEKDSIAKCLDGFYAAYSAKDAKAYMSNFSDDCLICGTDPGEFWNKETCTKLMTDMFADTAFKSTTFNIDKREIRLDKEGKSAVVVDQFIFKTLSEKIPVRNVTHFTKEDNKWMCDFTSMSFIPENADVAKILKSVME